MLLKQADVQNKLSQMPQMYKVFLSIVVIYLKLGDYIAADKAYQDFLQCVFYSILCQRYSGVHYIRCFLLK